MDQWPDYFRYWGKAEQSETGARCHLLPYHALDVAAVGYMLLEHPFYRTILARVMGGEANLQWIPFFLALHDLGKFSQSFQNLQPALLELLQGKQSEAGYATRHDSLGFLLWKQHLRQMFIDFDLLPSTGSGRRAETSETVIDLWMAIVTGHHGKPPRKEGLLTDAFVERDLCAVDRYVLELKALFPVSNTAPLQLSVAGFKRDSWWLAGFTVLCDWLGSNRGWFPYCEETMDLDEYWSRAKKQARRAIEESGLGPSAASSSISLEQLLQLPKGQSALSTPLQALSSRIVLPQSPQLIIMEDVTGAGKTEAALLLAHRMMVESGATGIYVGLPTMATANGMYRRIAPVVADFFDPDSRASLVLAHGAREMNTIFQHSKLSVPLSEEQEYGDGTEPAAAWCSQWLADNTKKALLANMGVGTIDQSLIGILPSKYQSLRLFGLLGKVLIVDEVHACDAYMHKLLGDLLKFHAASGGSAILLSATLSAGQRRSLLDWFASGVGERRSPEIKKTGLKDYPLLTHYSAGQVDECVVETREEVRREVRVTSVHDIAGVVARIEKAVSAGQCVCWICNTVPDAREARAVLTDRLDGCELFHARFCLHDRSQIESEVLDRFGPKSRSDDRQGRVVVATQVVEQSLDLDFDLLISDLAPIDLLIQRAGRLQRHTRDEHGNRIAGEDQRGIPELIIHGPVHSEAPDEEWIKSMLPGTAAVYSHHGQLWLTSRWINKHGKFNMPDDARDMVESVYGEDAQSEIPEDLLDKSLDAIGTASAEASIASLNMLKLETGYPDVVANQWWDEAVTPTRLGEMTTMIYLARLENGQLMPLRKTEKFSWQNSSLRMRTFWINSEADHPEIDEETLRNCKESLPGKGKWGVVLPLTQKENGQWVGRANNEKGNTNNFIYDRKSGLLTENDVTLRRENAAESD